MPEAPESLPGRCARRVFREHGSQTKPGLPFVFRLNRMRSRQSLRRYNVRNRSFCATKKVIDNQWDMGNLEVGLPALVDIKGLSQMASFVTAGFRLRSRLSHY